jgi:hypothetical protein
MNNDLDSVNTTEGNSTPRQEPFISSSHQRRRLLKSIASGSAVIGGSTPLLARATNSRPHCVKNSTNYHATASAVGSMVGSVAGTQPPNNGFHCTHYTTSSNWSSNCHNGKGRSVTYTNCADPNGTGKLRFYVLFNKTSAANTSENRYCSTILRDYPNSDEAHWIGAILNANKCSGTFPYTPGQVVDLYHGTNPFAGWQQSDIRGKALTLFRDYLSAVA